MLSASEKITQMMTNPVRQIKSRVELLNGSTLQNVFTYDDNLISFTVERTGAGRFYGYGYAQRLNVKLIDTNRDLEITTENTIDIAFGVDNEYFYTLPVFRVSEVHRDEKTNQLSITAYDAMYAATAHTVSEITGIGSYTIKTIATAAAALIGLNSRFEGLPEGDNPFTLNYVNGANLDGTETLRELFDAIAGATQTIYYMNRDYELVYRRLNIDGAPDLTIRRDDYFTLSSKTNKRLKTICHTTELGDNVSASILASGSTHYERNNPFYEMRDDIAEIIDAALSAVGGMAINQFDCEWRGNVLLEIGDKLELITKDGSTAYSYLLDDVIKYDGTLSQNTSWKYGADDGETESNPTSIGDAIKQTYARVDKANRNIELVASEAAANAESISALEMNTDSINASVYRLDTTTNASLNAIGEELAEIVKQVNATLTAEEIQIAIQSEMNSGASSVKTSTGFTLDDVGLTISKSNSEMETTITDDGMVVKKDGSPVLNANNRGVDAENLHATTYLIIGNNSRFEDYGSRRTGCFWIGEV